MKTGIPVVVLILSVWGLGGCQSEEKPSSNFVSRSLQEVAANHGSQPLSATQTPVHTQTVHTVASPKMSPIGIVVDRNRIIIDTNQTRHFLKSLTRKLDRNFRQIEKKLRKEKLRSPNETGIVITEDRIELDLNKTEHFVDRWIRSIEEVGRQLDGIARELDKSFNP